MADTTFESGTIITKEWLQDVNDAIYGAGGAVNANTVVVTPAGTISSTDVQAALEELDTDIQTKASSTHTHTSVYEPVITTLAVNKGGTGQSTIGAAAQAILDAVGTTQGDILYHNGTDWVVLAKGTANQLLAMNSSATAPEWCVSPFWESDNQTIAAGALVTVAHPFGSRPKFLSYSYVCLTAERNYSIGDVIKPAIDSNPPGYFGHVMYADANNVYVRFNDTYPMHYVVYKTTGAGTTLTAANWALRVIAGN